MKFFKVLISIVLVVATCVTMMMPASAARVTYYLSDLKMAEAKTADEAKSFLQMQVTKSLIKILILMVTRRFISDTRSQQMLMTQSQM